jgi:hypothetical protein
MKTKHIVAGLGEIGSAIQNVLHADGIDIDKAKNSFKPGPYEVLHICFPYSRHFAAHVKQYQKHFSPSVTVIHSTVPLGTSQKLGAVHSPVRGVHPHLEAGVQTFVKFFGGRDAKKAARYFSQKGIPVFCHPSARTTEAMKLWDTTVYGWNILLEKAIHEFCRKNKVDFDVVYTKSNETYNEGYEKLGKPQFKKYVLKHFPGPVGGHCVIPNLELFTSDVGTILKEYNRRLQKNKRK